MSTAPLEIVLALPPAPLTLATGGFMSTLAAVEAEIAATTSLTTPEAAQGAANIQSRLTAAETALEKQRKALKQPFIDAGKAIDAAANEPFARLASAKQTVKRLLTQYDEAERIKAANAERARQAEIARLQKIAADEKAEADRIANVAVAQITPLADISEATLKLVAAKDPKEIVAKAEQIGDRFRPLVTYVLGTSPIMAGPALFLTAVEATVHADLMLKAARDQAKGIVAPEVVDMGFDEVPPESVAKTETERQIEAIQHAPVVVAVKPVGITYRTTLVATVVDVNKLPDVFVERVAKLAAIKSTFCSGWSEGKAMPTCSGVEFRVDRTPVSTGR